MQEPSPRFDAAADRPGLAPDDGRGAGAGGLSRSVVVPDFHPDAAALRAVWDERFKRRREGDPESFVWDYWHVPGQYTYFRTKGDRYFPPDLTAALLARIRAWGRETLGCRSITNPWLSYYLDGCVQELHADVPHGPWAYVFSLTDWERRGFSGGETMMLRDGALDYWRGFDPSAGLGAQDVAELIPSPFNQLAVFDARVPHGVRQVYGTRDPLDSRIVLHGWFEYPGIETSDDLRGQEAIAALKLVVAYLGRRLASYDSVTGLLTVRVELDGSGSVANARVLSDTLVSTDGAPEAPREVARAVLERVRELHVPGAAEGSWATLPFRLPVAPAP
ncbi:MAG: hypothetical protein ACR2KP_05410 [Egibacteraceae bacterium]